MGNYKNIFKWVTDLISRPEEEAVKAPPGDFGFQCHWEAISESSCLPLEIDFMTGNVHLNDRFGGIDSLNYELFQKYQFPPSVSDPRGMHFSRMIPQSYTALQATEITFLGIRVSHRNTFVAKKTQTIPKHHQQHERYGVFVYAQNHYHKVPGQDRKLVFIGDLEIPSQIKWDDGQVYTLSDVNVVSTGNSVFEFKFKNKDTGKVITLP